MKLDFSMAKAGDKNVGAFEIKRPDGKYDDWDVIKRGRIYIIGSFTNTGLLSDYYYKMETGESEQNALEEINADLEVLARDGESYMSKVTRIPKRGIRKNSSSFEGGTVLTMKDGGIDRFRLASIKHGLKARKIGMFITRGATTAKLMAMLGEYTGVKYKRTDLDKAIADAQRLLDADVNLKMQRDLAKGLTDNRGLRRNAENRFFGAKLKGGIRRPKKGRMMFNNTHERGMVNPDLSTRERDQDSSPLKKLVMDLASDFAPVVKDIESSRYSTTQNNYGRYMSLISSMSKGDKKRAEIIAMALITAGANRSGVKSALRVMFGE